MTAVLQIFFALGSVGAALWWIPQVYMLMALLVMVLVFTIFTMRERSIAKMVRSTARTEKLPLLIDSVDLLYRVLLSMILGAIWPSLPVIIWLGRARDTSAPQRDSD